MSMSIFATVCKILFSFFLASITCQAPVLKGAWTCLGDLRT